VRGITGHYKLKDSCALRALPRVPRALRSDS